jgi:hypothetical protein
MILTPKPNPRKGESFVSHNSDLRRSGLHAQQVLEAH